MLSQNVQTSKQLTLLFKSFNIEPLLDIFNSPFLKTYNRKTHFLLVRWKLNHTIGSPTFFSGIVEWESTRARAKITSSWSVSSRWFSRSPTFSQWSPTRLSLRKMRDRIGGYHSWPTSWVLNKCKTENILLFLKTLNCLGTRCKYLFTIGANFCVRVRFNQACTSSDIQLHYELFLNSQRLCHWFNLILTY